jgi:hypothetical protein
LKKGCEESKIMMNKTMMEDKLMDQANSNFLKDKTSKEELLWVIQNGLLETTINEWKEDDKEANHLLKPLL